MEKAKQNKDNLIMYLEFLRDTEAAKPVDEMDTDLIEACVYVLLDLQDKHVSLTPEQIQEKVRSIPFKDSSEFDEYKKAKKKKLKKKRVLFIAACIGILAALLVLGSVATEWDIVKEYFGDSTKIPFNIEYFFDNESVIRHNSNGIYETISEAEKAENIDLLEPTYLPDGNEIVDIGFTTEEGLHTGIYGFSLGPPLSMEFSMQEKIPDDIMAFIMYTETINNLECHFVEMDDINMVQAYIMHNGIVYNITYNNKEELVKIIENLKE